MDTSRIEFWKTLYTVRCVTPNIGPTQAQQFEYATVEITFAEDLAPHTRPEHARTGQDEGPWQARREWVRYTQPTNVILKLVRYLELQVETLFCDQTNTQEGRRCTHITWTLQHNFPLKRIQTPPACTTQCRSSHHGYLRKKTHTKSNRLASPLFERHGRTARYTQHGGLRGKVTVGIGRGGGG